MAVTTAPMGVQNFISIRSQGSGPIKRPLTASFSSNIRKVLKEGKKPKLGETPTSRSLSKLLKSGTHAKPSLRRAASLLVLTTVEGRISHDSREKYDVLSLRCDLHSYWTSFPFFPRFVLIFVREKESCTLFCHFVT